MARGKARVHELAKELGVTSKVVLAHLKEQGELVKSASSTVEAPVARRLRERFAGDRPPGELSRRETGGSAPARNRAGERTFVVPSPRQRLTDSQIADLCRDYRQAYASKNYEAAIARVLTKYQELYSIRRSALHDILTEDKRRNVAVYTALRLSRSPEHAAAQPRKKPEAVSEKAEDEPQRGTVAPPKASTPEPRPRTRRAGLPPISVEIRLDAITDIVAAKETGRDRRSIFADLAPFDPTRPGGYGYLGWRYATFRRHSTDPAARTPGDELADIAHIVDSSKQRLQQIHDTAGLVLEHPNLAVRALESGFGDLFDPDDIGRSAVDERRRIVNKQGFLQRAIILAIADAQCADRLWDMIDQLRPPAQHQLFESTPQLRNAIEGLTGEIAAVDDLLSSDEATLERFVDRSRAELTEVNSGRFDYLQQFRDAGTAATTRVIHGLAFTVLPQGEHLRTFLDDLRRTKRYQGRHLDEHRLTVLEELQDHFGAHRCLWHKGSVTSHGVDNRYLILSIASTAGDDENAVAISPLAGEHATYVVRHECVDAHWSRIFELTKKQARHRGARRLPFRGEGDQYIEMRDKVIALLECDPADFRQ